LSEADAESKKSRAAARNSERGRTTPDPGSGSDGKGERRVRRKRVRRKRPPRTKALFGLLVFAIGMLVAGAAIYIFVVFPSGAGPGSGTDVEILVEPNEAPGSVVGKLSAAGLLRSPHFFRLYVRLVSPRIAPGKHLLTDDASPQELLRRMEREGAGTKAKVIIPEGWNRFEIARRLHALHVTTGAWFLDATTDAELLREVAVDGTSAEGFLFPATYEIALDTDPRDIVRRLVGEFDRRFGQLEQNHRLGRAQLEGSLGWNRREIVTLASMVEKEAAVDDERPIIASVFLNRLRDPAFKRKVLQCDPTSGYGCLVLREKVPSCAGFSGKVTHAINVDPLNPYSTYAHEGLPPGPIANPGVKSLQAVLAPTTTKYLYFVVRGDRRHAFSETLEEHNTAVKDFKERTKEH
jgi:peptidoglycan lytic transglycosylase G